MADDHRQELPILREVSEWPGGISWIAYSGDDGQRASHALATEVGVWVVDPVDADGLDDRLSELGEVAGVLVLQDRHTRDAEAVARRYDVSIHIPEWMDLTREKLDSTPESIGAAVPETNYTVHRLIHTDEWEEAILIDETTDTLVVPEALGTLPLFQADDNELGVHPALDDPPAGLADWTPDRILVGHGDSVHSEAAAKLRAAIEAE